MRYTFGYGNNNGVFGEIPRVYLEDTDDLLPLSAADSIRVDILYDKKEESRLLVYWRVGEKNIWVRVMCYANDKRFKKQLKEDRALAEKIINFLLECPENQKERRDLELGGKLAKSAVPEKLATMIDQIETWMRTLNFQDSKVSNITNQRYGPKVTKEGYYMFVVTQNAFSVSFHPDDFSPEYDFILLDFDPQKEPPEVNDECVSWKREKTKILVVLPHDSSNKQIADHYGYRAVYDEFVRKKKEEEAADRIRQDEYSIRVDERRKKEDKKAEEELRNALLL